MKTYFAPAPILIFVLSLLLAGCNLASQADVSPTLDSTQAYETVQARLTQAVALTPTVTYTPEPSPTSIPTATSTHTPATPSPTPGTASTPTTSVSQTTCDQASPGSPIDVTIPDDTVMTPGQAFTKTWRLRNAGTCTWSSSYSIVYFSGERMSAPENVPLAGNVAPGESVDVSVDMVAPTQPGTYQSNWKLRNASGRLFGIGVGEGLPFYVRIQVASDAPTLTPTAGASPTPQNVISGSAILFPADSIDLDTASINAAGADLLYVRDENDGELYLRPQENTLVAVYGGFQPQQADCRASNLGAGQLSISSLSAGVYLCYRSGNGNIGWLRYSAFNPDNQRLDVALNTWVP
jgi:hypothetical protein